MVMFMAMPVLASEGAMVVATATKGPSMVTYVGSLLFGLVFGFLLVTIAKRGKNLKFRKKGASDDGKRHITYIKRDELDRSHSGKSGKSGSKNRTDKR